MNKKFISITFKLNYITNQTQLAFVTGSLSCLGLWDTNASIPMTRNGSLWMADLQIPKRAVYKNNSTILQTEHLDFQYKYFIKEENSEIHWEENGNHHLSIILSDCNNVTITDNWGTGLSVFPPIHVLPANICPISNLQFNCGKEIFVVSGTPSYLAHTMKLVGNVDQLGNWNANKGVEMISYGPAGSTDLVWIASIDLSSQIGNNGLAWESGDNRQKIISSNPSGVNLEVSGYYQKEEGFAAGWAATGYGGMINTFASCCMNSVVQVLFHLPPFISELQNLTNNAENNNSNSSVGILTKLFEHLTVNSHSSANVRPLVERSGLAEDPHEFLLLLLFDLKAELQGDDMDKQTLVDTLFCGRQKISRIKIDDEKPRSVTIREEDFLGITLQVNGFDTLEQSLVNFHQPTTLSLAQHSYEQHIEYLRLPKVLLIHLNRIMFDSQFIKEIKLCNRFEYPKQFYFTPKNCYRLMSVIVHRGNNSASDGHFYAYIKRNKIWYRFDDENNEIVTQREAIENNFGGDSSLSHACIFAKWKKVFELKDMLIYVLDENVKNK